METFNFSICVVVDELNSHMYKELLNELFRRFNAAHVDEDMFEVIDDSKGQSDETAILVSWDASQHLLYFDGRDVRLQQAESLLGVVTQFFVQRGCNIVIRH